MPEQQKHPGTQFHRDNSKSLVFPSLVLKNALLFNTGGATKGKHGKSSFVVVKYRNPHSQTCCLDVEARALLFVFVS